MIKERCSKPGLPGPYKGGIRFHASVNLHFEILRISEQTFKNALTHCLWAVEKVVPISHHAVKSDAEIMRFCQKLHVEVMA